MNAELHWKIDECSEYYGGIRLRGWCHLASPAIVAVSAVFGDGAVIVPVTSFGRPSADVAAELGETAARCRFEEWLPIEDAAAIGRDFYLRLFLADGTSRRSDSVLANAAHGDPYYACWARFLEQLAALPPDSTVLEIGSRARSAVNRRAQIPAHLRYVGVDLFAGPNVDLAGDVHELDTIVGDRRFAAAFSFSVFEHLAMPWKAVLALNRVLAPGGIVFTATHQTWPLHDEPWDFWRFSQHAWQTLFNAATGYEVIEAVCGEPARIHAMRASPITRGMHHVPAFLGSAAIARKTGETALQWPVALTIAAAGNYPKGELAAPPS